MERRDLWPLGAIGFVLIVTAAWWTLALWSVPGAPEWLERTRSVCFNLTETGLPDTKGWLLLFGQAPTMLALLLVGWGDSVRGSVRRLASARGGRLAILTTLTLALGGLSLAAAAVRAAEIAPIVFEGDEAAPETYPRLDRPWPSMDGLVDQSGQPFDLSSLDGRAALVTFAFGHCGTMCPVVVHQTRQARLETDPDLVIVVITLDPWRDTPSRLPALLDQYGLDGASDFVVSGSIEGVNDVLDMWNMPRERDERSGDIIHPGLVYLVDGDGTIAYGSTGGVIQLTSLAARLTRS
jgi:cytochrome oxidase Cu insertion factor (SCO1/SenC/PrrC family)